MLSLYILWPATNKRGKKFVHSKDESVFCLLRCDENELPQLKAKSQLTRSSKTQLFCEMHSRRRCVNWFYDISFEYSMDGRVRIELPTIFTYFFWKGSFSQKKTQKLFWNNNRAMITIKSGKISNFPNQSLRECIGINWISSPLWVYCMAEMKEICDKKSVSWQLQ